MSNQSKAVRLRAQALQVTEKARAAEEAGDRPRFLKLFNIWKDLMREALSL